MLECEIELRIRYGETDRMGYAYYGYYPLYYEQGRSELLRKVGLAYREMEDSGYLLPVADMNIKYYLSVGYDELIKVRTYIDTMPTAKIIFHYEIYNMAGQLINEAVTTLVFVNFQTRKPCRAPELFINAMKPYFNSKA